MHDLMRGSEFESREGLRVCPWARYLSQNWFSESWSRCTGVIYLKVLAIKHPNNNSYVVIVIYRHALLCWSQWKRDAEKWGSLKFFTPAKAGKVTDFMYRRLVMGTSGGTEKFSHFFFFYFVFQMLSIYFETGLLTPNKQQNFAVYEILCVFGFLNWNLFHEHCWLLKYVLFFAIVRKISLPQPRS